MAIDKICGALDCTGCELCAHVCPKSAITMKPDKEGFFRPEVSAEKCVDCGICQKKCPVNIDTPKSEAEFFMGWSVDDEMIMKSSSGGIFSELARYVLKNGGCVFGAALDQGTRELRHLRADDEEGLEALRKSKYYQSRAGKSYEQVKAALDSGKQVLFSGTACQVAALRSYLGKKDYPNLLTVDVLCHGAASKKVIDGYTASMEKIHKARLKELNFRVKEGRQGWQRGGGTRMHLVFENGKDFVAEGSYDLYFLAFNNNFFLRESCYRCKYCGTDRVSDFTLADFWGCRNPKASPEQMKKGVSVILANTARAKEILSGLKDSVEYYEVDKNEVIPYNRALTKPQSRPEIRDTFFAQMEKKGYAAVVKKQFPKRFLKYGAKNFLRKVLPNKLQKKVLKHP